MAKQNKPAIRFKGFTDAWEQRKLSEIAGKVTEKNTGLQYVETLTNSAEFGIISQRDFFDHDISKLGSLDGYYIVRNEDFVYNPRISTSAPVGPINRNKLGRTGVMSPLYTVFRPHDIDTTYLEHFFKCGYWYSFMNFNGDSGARSDRFSIKDDVFFQMPIPVPHIEEQRKIGLFLTRLDHLITLHQRKYDKLQVLKKAMLEKMFPKNGSSVPEIRFKGFTYAWEQRKLGALCVEFKSGDFISASDIAENEAYPVYGGNGLRGFTNHYNHDGEYALIGRQGALCGNVNYAVGKSYFTEHAVAVRANKTNQTRFLYYLFSTMNLGQYSGQSAQPGLAVGNLVELENVVPSKPEQEKIASFLSSLDNLITLHQRELEKLQNIKKSMLEKMFV